MKEIRYSFVLKKLLKTLTNFTFDAFSDIFKLEVNAFGCPVTTRSSLNVKNM